MLHPSSSGCIEKRFRQVGKPAPPNPPQDRAEELRSILSAPCPKRGTSAFHAGWKWGKLQSWEAAKPSSESFGSLWVEEEEMEEEEEEEEMEEKEKEEEEEEEEEEEMEEMEEEEEESLPGK